MSDQVAPHLNKVLADAVVFAYKLHNHHWFVKGRSFFTLHEQFESMYNTWGAHIDDIAERVLQIGGRPLPTLASALEIAAVREQTATPDADAMVRTTIDDLQTIRARVLAAIEAAELAGDRSTGNLLDGILDGLEKSAWMLRAHLA